MDIIDQAIRKVAGDIASNVLQREMIRLRKAHPRWSASELMTAATMSPELTDAHRRERRALAEERRDAYAKAQTAQPGEPSDAVHALLDPQSARAINTNR
jgi:hypothetical protein